MEFLPDGKKRAVQNKSGSGLNLLAVLTLMEDLRRELSALQEAGQDPAIHELREQLAALQEQTGPDPALDELRGRLDALLEAGPDPAIDELRRGLSELREAGGIRRSTSWIAG